MATASIICTCLYQYNKTNITFKKFEAKKMRNEAFILSLVIITVNGNSFIYSNDTMMLSLSSNTRNLMDITSSTHSLEWILKNSGGSHGTFHVSQYSPHGVMGQIKTQVKNSLIKLIKYLLIVVHISGKW